MQDSRPVVADLTDSRNLGRLRQISASFIISLVTLTTGMITGWMSPMGPLLMGKDSPVGVLTKEELSTLAALPNYVALLFAPAFTVLVHSYGRRPGLRVVGILCFMSAIITAYSTSKPSLYLGRLLAGFNAFGVLLAPIYVAETVHNSLRGVLTTICTIQLNFGILISYIAGNLLTYKGYNSIMIGIPMVFTLFSFWFPESPYFLFDQSRKEEALDSILWFRGQNLTVARDEFESMESARAGRITEEAMNFLRLFKTTGTKRALIICMCLGGSQTLSGIQVVLNYNELIYEEVNSPILASYSTYISATLILIGSCVGILVVDSLGRKPLLYLSFASGSVCMTVLSICLLLTETGKFVTGHSWIAFACLNIFIFTYGMGLSFVPGLVLAEVTQSRVRPTLSAVITVFVITLTIIILQSFSFIDGNFGLYAVFVVPAVINLFGGLFTWFVVPETKGRSLTEITEEMNRT